MQGISTKIIYLIIFLQGGFAGLFAGQLLTLIMYKKPQPWLSFGAIGLAAVLCLLFFYRKRLQMYVLKYISFTWLHFFYVAYSMVMLLLLLPALFNFEESAWIVYALQSCSLIALGLLLADYQLLHQGLLQKVYADLLQCGRRLPYLEQLLWLCALITFTFLAYNISGSETAGLTALLQSTFYFGLALWLLSAGLKIALFMISGSLHPYTPPAGHKIKESAADFHEHNYYYLLKKDLKEVLLKVSPEERPPLYAIIRQIPLIDKIEELELIFHQHLPGDEALSHTLASLKKLRNELPPTAGFNDIDRLQDVLAVKACIRTVIGEGNSMLVQKLLSDNRPEVKKAAMLATVYFREAAFIPALVNLLKEYRFSFTAKQALQEWGDQCIPFLRSAKYRNKNNSFFIEQCIGLVESYQSPEARDFLIEMLNEPQKQFQYRAAMALLKNGYALTALHKTQILHFIETLIGTMAILRGIRCGLSDHESLLYQALLEEEREKRTIILDLLQAFLPGPVWRQLMKMLEDPSPRPATLCALVDLFLPLVLRNKCKILLASGEHEDIGPALQPEYLHEQICYHYAAEAEAIRQVLKLDYSGIGCWLRLCALKQLAGLPDQQASLHLLGEMFNQNPLLQETAAEVLYNLNHDYYYLYMQRLQPDRAKVLRYKIESRMAPAQGEGQADAQLLYDQLLFLRSLPLFEGCSYERLAAMLKFFNPCSLDAGTSFLQADPYRPAGYWIISQGALSLFYGEEFLLQAGRGDVVDMSFLADTAENRVGVRTKDEIKFYFIEKITLNNLHLKSDYFKKNVSQPIVNQSAQFQPAYRFKREAAEVFNRQPEAPAAIMNK